MRSEDSGSSPAARLQVLRGEEPAPPPAAGGEVPAFADFVADPPAAPAPGAFDRLPAWLPDSWSDALAGRSPSSVITVAAVVLAVVIGGAALLHHRSPTQAASPAQQSALAVGTAGAAGASTAGTGPAVVGAVDDASIVVDVGGRVRHPGLVTLPAGSRVADALSAAGGPLRHKETARLDLAAKVADGQLLLIGVPGDSPATPADTSGATGTTAGSAGPVDLNSATVEQLDSLPGIGPVTAQKIVDWRTAHNGFSDVAQLQQVSGIGPVTYNDIKGLVSA